MIDCLAQALICLLCVRCVGKQLGLQVWLPSRRRPSTTHSCWTSSPLSRVLRWPRASSSATAACLKGALARQPALAALGCAAARRTAHHLSCLHMHGTCLLRFAILPSCQVL